MARVGRRWCLKMTLIASALLVIVVNLTILLWYWPDLIDLADNEDPLQLLHSIHRVRERRVDETVFLDDLRIRLKAEQLSCGRNKTSGLLQSLKNRSNRTSLQSADHCDGFDQNAKPSPTYSVILCAIDDNKFAPRKLLNDLYRILLDKTLSDITVLLSRKTVGILALDADYGQRILNWNSSIVHKTKLVVDNDHWSALGQAKPNSDWLILVQYGRHRPLNIHQTWQDWKKRSLPIQGMAADKECTKPAVETILVVPRATLCFLHHNISRPLQELAIRRPSVSWQISLLLLGRLSRGTPLTSSANMLETDRIPDEVWNYLG